MRPRPWNFASSRGAVLVAVALVAAACGSDGGTATADAELQTLLDDTTDRVEELPDEAETDPPPTEATIPEDGGSEGLDHNLVALRGLGDDPDLDEVAVDCFQADLSSCDDLYVGSPDGSLYEAYGATCGARIDEPTNRLCVDVLLPLGSDPVGLGADDFLQALAEQCYQGDLLDCDILFANAETNSAYERYGGSCGDRVETDLDCRQLLD